MALVRNVKQLGCVFQDVEPPKVRLILRKGTNSLRPTRRVQFAPDALQSRKNSGEKKPHPHERSFFVSTFEDRTQEDTLAEEQWARGEAWRLGQKVQKLKGDLDQSRETFFSPSEVCCLPAPSSIKLEEREYVLDSRRFSAHAEQGRLKFIGTGKCKSVWNIHKSRYGKLVKCKRTRKRRCVSKSWIYS